MLKKLKILIITISLMISVILPYSIQANNVTVLNGILTENESNLPWQRLGFTVVLEEGFINMAHPRTDMLFQWSHEIIFTGPVVAGESLSELFVVTWATTIEGLHYLDTSNVKNMSSMFERASNLTSLDLSAFNTGNVTDMAWMFWGATSLTDVDLSGWDTSKVVYMRNMFANTISLTNLNLSDFDTSNVTDMMDMFRGTYYLRQLTLGENFRFMLTNLSGNYFDAGLPSVPSNDEFTGFWRNVGTGTVDNPQGEFVFTSEELMENYNGSIHADTWVWQPRDNVILPSDEITIRYKFLFLLTALLQVAKP